MRTDPVLVNCLAGIAFAMFSILAVIAAAPVLTATIRPFVRRHPLFVAFAFVAVLYGGTKPSFRYDGGIQADEARKSYATNDTVYVAWRLDPHAGVIPPETAPVYIDYRPIGATNEEWGCLAQSTVGAREWTGELAGATNYDYSVYAYYIPPEPIHTNGVWEYRTILDPERKRYVIPLRATINGDDRTIYPPKHTTEE